MKAYEAYSEQIQEFIREITADGDVQACSHPGCGVWGKSCLGLYLSNEDRTLTLWDLALVASSIDWDFAYWLGSPKTDQLGRSGMVVYWPKIPASILESEEEGSSDADE